MSTLAMIGLGRLIFNMNTRKNVGRTLFAPLTIVPEYLVDLEKGQVIGVVKFNKKVYLTIIVDVPNGKVVTKGSLRRIFKHTKPFKKKHYIKIIKQEVEYLIENKIINLKND